MTSVSISVKRRCSVQCIFISSQMKKQLVVPVMGRRGHTPHTHTPPRTSSASAGSTQKFRHQNHYSRMNISTSALFITHMLNVGHASKWLFRPSNKTKGISTAHKARAQDWHFSTCCRSSPRVLPWQRPWMRTENFTAIVVFTENSDWQQSSPAHSNLCNVCHERISLIPSHLTYKNPSLFYIS